MPALVSSQAVDVSSTVSPRLSTWHQQQLGGCSTGSLVTEENIHPTGTLSEAGIGIYGYYQQQRRNLFDSPSVLLHMFIFIYFLR